MDYILGLDLGETSLGWSVIETKEGVPYRFENFGVRIFQTGVTVKAKSLWLSHAEQRAECAAAAIVLLCAAKR